MAVSPSSPLDLLEIYAPFALAFLSGMASGVQAIYDRYGKDLKPSLLNFSGMAFLLVKGLFPVLVYWGIAKLPAEMVGSIATWPPWVKALFVGVSTEAFLRSSFSFNFKDEPAKQVSHGGLDLLLYFQDIFFKGVAPHVGAWQKNKVKEFTKTNQRSFEELTLAARTNMSFIGDDELEAAVGAILDRLEQEFLAIPTASRTESIEENLVTRLAQGILKLVGEHTFKTMLDP